MIYFANLQKLYLLPIFILLIILFIRNYYRLKKTYLQLVSIKHSKIVFPNFSLPKQRIKLFLIIFALITLFIAILRPQFGSREVNVTQEGRDLLIVLDVSRSMLVKDIKPNRLEFAKLKIRNLLEKLSFERVGLIIFSGSAFVICPLTSDYSAFLMFLNQVDVESISSGTTAFDKALLKVIDTYFLQKNRKNKLVLFLTDGEDFSSNLNSVKKQSAQLNLKVFALGLGTEGGGPIPILDEYGKQLGHEIEQNGKPAISKLNESLLKIMCQELGGDYFRSSYDDSDIGFIIDSVQKFEKEKFEERKITQFEDRYPWFLGAAWILILLEWLV